MTTDPIFLCDDNKKETVTVPREPTDLMINAAFNELDCTLRTWEARQQNIIDMYKAMIEQGEE